jgi:hypothetical protein
MLSIVYKTQPRSLGGGGSFLPLNASDGLEFREDYWLLKMGKN